MRSGRCSDCGVEPGRRHQEGCDVSRCVVCGQQDIQCDEHLDAPQQRWTGRWPGDVEVEEGLATDLNDLARRGLGQGTLVWSQKYERWFAATQTDEDRTEDVTDHRPNQVDMMMEKTLQEANRSHEEPDVALVASLINWYRTLPGNAVGGSLHIVIEDQNLDHSSVQFCYGYASAMSDGNGVALANLLLRMDAWDRVHAVWQANGGSW